MLALGGEAVVQIAWDVSAVYGIHDVYVTVDPLNAISANRPRSQSDTVSNSTTMGRVGQKISLHSHHCIHQLEIM